MFKKKDKEKDKEKEKDKDLKEKDKEKEKKWAGFSFFSTKSDKDSSTDNPLSSATKVSPFFISLYFSPHPFCAFRAGND